MLEYWQLLRLWFEVLAKSTAVVSHDHLYNLNEINVLCRDISLLYNVIAVFHIQLFIVIYKTQRRLPWGESDNDFVSELTLFFGDIGWVYASLSKK